MTSSNQSATEHNTSFAPPTMSSQVDSPIYKYFVRTAAIDLVHDLFKHVGLNRLRANDGFKLADFIDATGLDNFDLAGAIAVGLDELVAAAHLSHNTRLVKRAEQALGPLAKPIQYSVEGWSKEWMPVQTQ